MLSFFSAPRKVVIHEFTRPKMTEHSEIITVRFSPNHDCSILEPVILKDVFSKLTSRIDTSEQAILTGIFCLHIHNERNEHVTVALKDLFALGEVSDSKHPDFTNCILIGCPAEFSGRPPQRDMCVYRPLLKKDDIVQFAGLGKFCGGPQDRSKSYRQKFRKFENVSISNPLLRLIGSRFAAADQPPFFSQKATC